jgi:hypothetical protein
MISSSLTELMVCHREHIAAMNAIYPVCWSMFLAVTRSESKEVRHKDCHPEFVLMTTPRKTILLTPAVAFTLLSRPMELNTQKETLLMEMLNQLLTSHSYTSQLTQLKVKVTLRLTVSQSVNLGAYDQIFITLTVTVLFCGAPSLTKHRSAFCICCWPSPA